MSKLLKYSIVMVIALSLALAGCGQQPTGPGTGDGEESRGTVIWAQGNDASYLDPGYAYTAEDCDPVFQIFETLIDVEVDAQGVVSYVPKLATEWTGTEDGTVWTFKLREGVKFHDGTDFNADAVVFSFKRLYDESHPYYMPDRWSYFVDLLGDFLLDVVAVDPMTVEMQLSEPFAPFLTYMGYYSEAIVSPTAVEKYGDEFFKHPVGTGPFVLDDWVKDERIVLVPFDDYWGEGPKVDRIIFRVLPEVSTRLAELEAGGITMFMNPPPEHFSRIQSRPNLALHSEVQAMLVYVGINHERPPFDDVRFRQAMAHGVDWAKMIEVIWGEQADVASTALPRGLLGFDDSIAPFEYDPDKAIALLEDMGLSDGVVIDMIAPNAPRWSHPDPITGLEMAQSDLQKIGVTLNPRPMEMGALMAALGERDYGMSFTGWWDVPDPHNFLHTLAIASGEERWFYFNPTLRDLGARAASTYVEAERAELYKEMQQILYDDVALIPIAYSKAVFAVDDSLGGFEIRTDGFVDLNKVYFNK